MRTRPIVVPPPYHMQELEAVQTRSSRTLHHPRACTCFFPEIRQPRRAYRSLRHFFGRNSLLSARLRTGLAILRGMSPIVRRFTRSFRGNLSRGIGPPSPENGLAVAERSRRTGRHQPVGGPCHRGAAGRGSRKRYAGRDRQHRDSSFRGHARTSGQWQTRELTSLNEVIERERERP